MKIIKKVVRQVEQEEVEDIVCNKCGETCNVVPEGTAHFKEFNGIIEYDVMGGYFGNTMGDGDQYRFSVCEKCLIEFMKTFKHDPYVGNIMDCPDYPDPLYEMAGESEQTPDNSRFTDPFGKEDETVELVQPYPLPKKEDLN